MEITLLNGHFDKKSAIALLSDLIAVKIKYHENQIHAEALNEEDLKMSENRIKVLQRELKEVISYCNNSASSSIDLASSVVVK